MSRLTSLQGTFRAHVLRARLVDEGFDVELRGALDGPYGLTVGDLARVDVYVPGDQIEEASMVLLVNEVDEVDERFDDDDRPPVAARRHVSGRVVAALDPVRARRRTGRAGAALVLSGRGRVQLSSAVSSSPLMRRNARRGRARSSNATSS